MDELRGPNIQVVLHIKEGIGFGFLRAPFLVSGSLNGYLLETDPVVPCHAPVFDAELVWEADKRRFRSLRVQNVPIKVEVFTIGTQGRKDKVGYFLLSLLGAQPHPSNKIIDVKHSWHRLLGLKAEAKCCQPSLQMSLTIHDRLNSITPRNELQLFHSNEVAYPTNGDNPTAGSMLLTMKEYISEGKKGPSTPGLQPQLLCDEGLIQIGSGKNLFVLSFVVGSVENLDLSGLYIRKGLALDLVYMRHLRAKGREGLFKHILFKKVPFSKDRYKAKLLADGASNEDQSYYVSYSVFTHDIQTDRVKSVIRNACSSAQFNQRTSLRLRSSLPALSHYFAECPHLIIRVCDDDKEIGICSLDLRKMIPTEDLREFTTAFCDMNSGLRIHERCFLLRCDEGPGAGARGERRPYVDVEMTLRYAGDHKEKKPTVLSAHSVTHIETGGGREGDPSMLDYRSGSCTNVSEGLGPAYTHMGVCNTARFKNASGEAMIPTNEIAEMIKKMYDTFQESQEKLLAAKLRPTTSDMQVQCEPEPCPKETDDDTPRGNQEDNPRGNPDTTPRPPLNDEPVKLETSRSDTYIDPNFNKKEYVKKSIPALERNELMQKCVEELEDWKERQQEFFKISLKRKEEYHLELLAKEWSKKQVDLECKLSKGIEQCRHLAADLSRATDDFRLKGFRNTEREKKLAEAKKALEAHYTAKYQELRLASQKLEDDMQHQLKLKDIRIQELEASVKQLEKQVQVLQNNLKNNEKENENKYSGLTKDQTASLIQELRCLEEKLDSAVQSKAFFKEQWGRAVRELHLSKLHTRRQMLSQLQQDRRQLGEMGLDTTRDEHSLNRSQVDIKRLKDDFYVDLLAHTPGLDAASIISATGPDEMEMFDSVKNKNPANAKLNELIMQRDQLIQQDSPDEGLLMDLNREIRSMLLNCGTT